MAKPPSSDARRTHWTEEDARQVLDEWRRSGDTLAAFARARGLVPERIAWWRKRLAGSRSTTGPALTLVPATVVTMEPAVVLRLPNGLALEVSNASPSWIAAVARELTRSVP
jgi:transposase-like protein